MRIENAHVGIIRQFQLRRATEIKDSSFAFATHGLGGCAAQQLAPRDIPPGGAFPPERLELELSVHRADLFNSYSLFYEIPIRGRGFRLSSGADRLNGRLEVIQRHSQPGA